MDKKYPIGDFDYDRDFDISNAKEYIDEIRSFPAKLRVEVQGLSDEILSTPYREGGWTLRQVIHHVGDSHMNAFVRVKLALTEENPSIKPYDEAAWATLADYETVSVEDGIRLLEVLHTKWCALLDTMTEDQFSRTFQHPESGINYSLINATAMYAWHSNHHLAHIQLITKS